MYLCDETDVILCHSSLVYLYIHTRLNEKLLIWIFYDGCVINISVTMCHDHEAVKVRENIQFKESLIKKVRSS